MRRRSPIADRRYGFVSGAARQAVRQDQWERVDWSEAVDRIVVSRILGLPIPRAVHVGHVRDVFRLGSPPMEWISELVAAVSRQLGATMPAGDLRSLLVDGVLGGVGGVLVFVPNIALLFLAIAILEDSGYMARAALRRRPRDAPCRPPRQDLHPDADRGSAALSRR